MPKSYLIQAWCIRPFISFLDPVEADTPEDAIAIARTQQDQLLDAAEECNYHVSAYPWAEFAAYDEACLRNAAPAMRDTLLFVAQELAGFKPDFLRQVGLQVVLEQVEKALAIADGTATEVSASAAEDDHD